MQQHRFDGYDNSKPVSNVCDIHDIQTEADVDGNIMKAAVTINNSLG